MPNYPYEMPDLSRTGRVFRPDLSYKTPPFVPEAQAKQPSMPGSFIGDLFGKSMRAPKGLLDFGKGAGGALGSIASIGGGAVGAGTGLMDFLRSKSVGGDILGGAKTGAGIGTMFAPGLGTAIGAGLGALGGGVRSLFRMGKPSQDELAGRQYREASVKDITRGASEGQMSEAQNAMSSGTWKNTQDPLTLIVMRDHLRRSGMDPAKADLMAQQYMRNMWDATKTGVSGVQGATPSPNVRF